MIDVVLRRAKDLLLQPVARGLSDKVNPLTVTLIAGVVGLLAALAGWQGHYTLGLLLWWANRTLDGLDGSLARASGKQSDWGGYIDTLVDFAMYTVIPFGLTMRQPSAELLIVLALLFGTFYVNAAAFLYLSAILERRNLGARQHGELTSVTMPRGIIEGTEAVIFFSLFFLLPQYLIALFAILAILVFCTTLQHIFWASRHLKL
jgi:phosphatidylglycerophosphate synthase